MKRKFKTMNLTKTLSIFFKLFSLCLRNAIPNQTKIHSINIFFVLFFITLQIFLVWNGIVCIKKNKNKCINLVISILFSKNHLNFLL
jgi:hypothetical protein